ncbi:uncharacterized protein LOC125678331 [Ostrea edulis]|uniref:uncharacterized protein LOC125678331 n=1 Tax=Ostrea edulis TaxID=37623 RepID=UPI0024AF4EF8|nr:uncharacterized protein LOC125678331 [Ostrea edulis]
MFTYTRIIICFYICAVYHAEAQPMACTDTEENCDHLILTTDICNLRPSSALFLCAKTCNMCNIDPANVTNPTNPIPTHTAIASSTIQSSVSLPLVQSSFITIVQSSKSTPTSIGISTQQPSATVSSTSGSTIISCDKHKTATITVPDTDHNTCYYFYDLNRRYKDAKHICEAESTHVVHLETDEEELRLTRLMTGYSPQFWLGMEVVGGDWHWVGNGLSSPVMDDLWEGQHSPTGHEKYAYNTPPDHWKTGDSNMEYRVLCEENF